MLLTTRCRTHETNFCLQSRSPSFGVGETEKSYSPGVSFLRRGNAAECDRMQEYADRPLYGKKLRPFNHLKIAEDLGLATDEKTAFLLSFPTKAKQTVWVD